MVPLCWSTAFLKKDLQEMLRLVKDLTFSKASISDQPVQSPSRIYPNLQLCDICMIKVMTPVKALLLNTHITLIALLMCCVHRRKSQITIKS